MKPIRKMRLFAAALAVACLLAATVRTVAAGRGKAVLTGVVYGDGAPLAGVCVSVVANCTPSNWVLSLIHI